jgi:hypothetical protein
MTKQMNNESNKPQCSHPTLKRQYVGDQSWYRCECGQKFKVLPWDGKVKVVLDPAELNEGVGGEPAPVPMNLFCPFCGTRHVDEGEWATRPHKTHQCQSCMKEWRLFPYPTVGVPAVAPEGEAKRCIYCGQSIQFQPRYANWRCCCFGYWFSNATGSACPKNEHGHLPATPPTSPVPGAGMELLSEAVTLVSMLASFIRSGESLDAEDNDRIRAFQSAVTAHVLAQKEKR